MISLSKRGDIAAFLAMDVMREAGEIERAGGSVCHMEVGQPGTAAPKLVRDAAHLALDNELIGYTQALGIGALRERIALHYDEAYGAIVDPSQVVITTGSSAGFVLAFLATLDAGDAVAITRPGYPCYREIIKALDLRPVSLPVGFHNGWMPSAEQVKQAIEEESVKALLLASPANPTGVMLSYSRLKELSDLARARGVWFLSDEIYHGLTYGVGDGAGTAGAGAFSALSVGDFGHDHVIVLNSFSKYYSMTGWRIGWMVVPPGLVRRMEKLNQHLFISAPALSQLAAVAAFDAQDELEGIRAQYEKNRAIVLDGLMKAGFRRFAPADGAFYVYVDVSEFTEDSFEFSQILLRDYGIAACPGVDFDDVDGKHMMRFSYAGTERDVAEAMKRLIEKPLLTLRSALKSG